MISDNEKEKLILSGLLALLSTVVYVWLVVPHVHEWLFYNNTIQGDMNQIRKLFMAHYVIGMTVFLCVIWVMVGGIHKRHSSWLPGVTIIVLIVASISSLIFIESILLILGIDIVIAETTETTIKLSLLIIPGAFTTFFSFLPYVLETQKKYNQRRNKMNKRKVFFVAASIVLCINIILFIIAPYTYQLTKTFANLMLANKFSFFVYWSCIGIQLANVFLGLVFNKKKDSFIKMFISKETLTAYSIAIIISMILYLITNQLNLTTITHLFMSYLFFGIPGYASAVAGYRVYDKLISKEVKSA